MRLLGLGVQLEMNIEIWGRLYQSTVRAPDSPSWDARAGIMHALEEFLTSPFVPRPDQLPRHSVVMGLREGHSRYACEICARGTIKFTPREKTSNIWMKF